MADGIGAIGQGNTSGIGGFYARPKENNAEESQAQEQAVVNNYEETQLDPNQVMDILSNNAMFVNIVKTAAHVEGVVTDPTVADRVAGYMENYEFIMGIIEDEFGSELAPQVMDMVMDSLMGMVD